MSEPNYLNFDLWVCRDGDGFQAKGWDPQGREALVPFESPWSSLEVENFRLRIGRPRRGLRRAQAPEIEAAKSFGGPLFESVFHGELLSCFRASLDEARQKEQGLRLRLRLEQAPELADLPWEYLYDQSLNRFLALSLQTPVVRYLELPERILPLPVEGALRVMVMLSSPSDFEQLDVEGEWQRLREAMSDLIERGLIELYRLREASLDSLRQELRRQRFHIFHFIGHGGFRESSQEGLLVLQDEEGGGRPVSAESLGVVLHDHPSLRLVTLNACEGGRASQLDPFAGVAQTLIQQGIPAVVAMQAEITDDAAVALAHEFYRALADGYPVDSCLTEARKAVSATENVEWGTPVLYLRAPDGSVFDRATSEESTDDAGEGALLAAPAMEEASTRLAWQRKRRLTVAALLAAGFFVALLFWMQRDARTAISSSAASTSEQPAMDPASVKVRPALAVLEPTALSTSDEGSWMGTAVAEMLTTELGMASGVRPVAGEQVAQAALELSIADPAHPSAAELAALGRRLDATWVVAGSYTQLAGDGVALLRMDLRLYEVSSGRLLTTAGATGAVAQLFDLTLRAGEVLRAELPAGRLSTEEQLALRAALPKDPEAARLYAEGLASLRQRDPLQARQHLRAAQEIDPQHPLPRFALAEAHRQLGEAREASASARSAVDRSGELPDALRQQIAARADELEERWELAIAGYRELIQIFPDELDHRLALARCYMEQGLLRETATVLEEAGRLPAPVGEDPRIDLHSAAVEYLFGDFEQAQQLASATAQRAAEVGNVSIEAEARIEEALAWQSLGNPQAEATAIEAARRLYEDLGLQRGVARTLQLMGMARARQGDLEGAIQLSERALATFRDIGFEANAAKVLTNLAALSADKGDYVAARRYVDESNTYYQRSQNQLGLAMNTLNAGVMLYERGDLDGAAERYTESISIFSQLGARPYQALALSNLGEVQYYRGELDQARRTHQETLGINRELGDAVGIGYDSFRLGEVLAAQGDLFLARARYEEALSQFDTAKEGRYAAEARAGLARVALYEGKLDEAEQQARAAEQSLRGEGVEVAPLGALVLAEVLLAQGRTEEAKEAMDRHAGAVDDSRDPRIRWAWPILRLKLRAAAEPGSDKVRTLLIEQARRSSSVPVYRFEALLAAAQLATGDQRAEVLRALADEARDAGFGGVADRARQVLRAP